MVAGNVGGWRCLHAGFMCSEDLAWLSDWRPRYRRSDDAILSLTGWTELREIGQSVRFRVARATSL